MVEYNKDSDSNEKEDTKFVDVNLSYNKLSVQLLVNDSTAHLKKKDVILETKDKVNKSLKIKIIREKAIPVKQVKKKCSKASVFISGLVSKSPQNMQALFMNPNIVIPALDFFQILPKFQEDIKHLMIVSHKPYKKKVMSFAIPIIQEK